MYDHNYVMCFVSLNTQNKEKFINILYYTEEKQQQLNHIIYTVVEIYFVHQTSISARTPFKALI